MEASIQEQKCGNNECPKVGSKLGSSQGNYPEEQLLFSILFLAGWSMMQSHRVIAYVHKMHKGKPVCTLLTKPIKCSIFRCKGIVVGCRPPFSNLYKGVTWSSHGLAQVSWVYGPCRMGNNH